MRYNTGNAIRDLLKLIIAFVFTACKHDGTSPLTNTEGIENRVTIDLNDKKQTIRNFGASDAWACQFAGLWPDARKNQIADWLFSKSLDETGKPKGIGLSLWRFNIGAGSATQNNITDEWRRTESFLQNDGNYDWTRQAGQQWFMQAAKERGVKKFLGFTNSPPIQFTKNGKAFSSNGEEANIAPANYLKFANFLVDVTGEFESKGIPFDYLSPFNEPQWDWTGNGQEGSPYKNDEIYAITKILDSLLAKKNSPVKIQIGEAGKLNYLYEKADKATRGDQVNQFFNQQSPLYFGSFSHVDKIISGHSYFTSAPVQTLTDVRNKVANKIAAASLPLEFWQSEYCILGDQEEVPGSGKDTGITPALYVARVIHHDLTVANASAWHWWLAVSAYDYKDGLIYIDKNKTDGKVEDTKLLWALGNYSRFIKPGAVRVGVSAENFNAGNANGTMISSFINPDNELVIVALNYGNTEFSAFVKIKDGEANSFQQYITGPRDDEKLKPLGTITITEKISIPAKSIVTLVGDLN
jgi:O-glycosyl hydrolase